MLAFSEQTRTAKMKVNILDAKNQLSRLVKAAQAGEEVIIANRGEPVARLIAIRTPAANDLAPGSGAALLGWLGCNPVPEHLRRTHPEISTDIEAERTSWD
jgi:prevent-host-death family protein